MALKVIPGLWFLPQSLLPVHYEVNRLLFHMPCCHYVPESPRKTKPSDHGLKYLKHGTK
jgi:hypothetical protein